MGGELLHKWVVVIIFAGPQTLVSQFFSASMQKRSFENMTFGVSVQYWFVLAEIFVRFENSSRMKEKLKK